MYSDREKDIVGGDIGAFNTVKGIGRKIIKDIKPKFIICVSAHWQSRADNLIEIAVPKKLAHRKENDLIYDFYGFPDYMYKETFQSENDLSIANDIMNEINNSPYDIKARLTERGIDHGTWVPLKVAFKDGELIEQDIPLIQVSLTRNDRDFESNHQLGKVLASFRDKGGLIIASGMTVHNLKDAWSHTTKDYTPKFTNTINDILLTKEHNKLDKFKALLGEQKSRELLFKAHPSLEHFLPLIVALGASEPTNDDLKIKELYNRNHFSLGWGCYQFGDLL